MPTPQELNEAIMAAGNRLLEAQALELKLLAEKENRPGLLKEVRSARGTVDVLASEYLESIRRCRRAKTDQIPSNARSRNFGTRAFLASFPRPWHRRRSPSTDRLEQLCFH